MSVDVKDIAWLAGIIDGEGSVTMAVSRSKKTAWYVPHLSIVNTDPSIISATLSILQAVGCRYHISDRKIKGHIGKKQCWQIVVHHFSSLRDVLAMVQPHLRSERAGKAEMMVLWLDMRIPKIQKGGNASRGYTESENAIANNLRLVSSRSVKNG